MKLTLNRKQIQAENLRKRLISLAEKMAILWVQAHKIDGTNPKATALQFSPGNTAAERYAVLSQQYKDTESAYMMLTGKKPKGIMSAFNKEKKMAGVEGNDVEYGDFQEDIGAPPVPTSPTDKIMYDSSLINKGELDNKPEDTISMGEENDRNSE